MPTLGKIPHKKAQWMANMTEQNHLGAALMAKPAQLSVVMDKLFSAQNVYAENPLSSQMLGADKIIDTTSWEYQMKGADSKPAVVIENISGSDAGKYGREFKIKLDIDHFLPSDVIAPGNKDFQCRVQADRVKSGNGFIYTLAIMTEDQNASIPAKYLAPGAKWVKLFSAGSEGNKQRGSTVFNTPITFSNHTGKLGKQYSVTDYASTEVLRVMAQDSKGKSHPSWVRYAEVEFWLQWYREQERALWYSKSTSSIDSNGRPVRSFPGIQEQLKDGHTYTYNQLTSKLIEEFLMDIFFGRKKPGGNKVKGFTGSYGLQAFHRAISDLARSQSGFIQLQDNIKDMKVGSKYHDNALGYGYQFTRYRMANGIELELIYNPLYDDPEIHTDIDPLTGQPYESQRITFLDFAGESAGESNIMKVKKKDGYAFAYIEGLYGPYGPSKGGRAATPFAGYEMHVEDTFGLQITDVTKTGELILGNNL